MRSLQGRAFDKLCNDEGAAIFQGAKFKDRADV